MLIHQAVSVIVTIIIVIIVIVIVIIIIIIIVVVVVIIIIIILVTGQYWVLIILGRLFNSCKTVARLRMSRHQTHSFSHRTSAREWLALWTPSAKAGSPRRATGAGATRRGVA